MKNNDNLDKTDGSHLSTFSSTAELVFDESKRNSIKKQLYYFASTTKAHGFLQVATTEALSGRILWIIIMALTFGGLIFHFITMLMIFLAHEVQTEMVNNAVPFEMPTVIICPDAPYAKLFKVDRPVIFNMTLTGAFDTFNAFWKLVNKTTNIQEKSRFTIAPYAQEYQLFTLSEDLTVFCKYNNAVKCNVSNFMIEDLSVCAKIDIPLDTTKTSLSQLNVWYSFFTDASYLPNTTFYNSNYMYILRTAYLTYQAKEEYPNFHSTRISGFKQFMTTINLNIRIQNEFLVKNSCLSNPEPMKILSYGNAILQFSYTKSLCLMVKKQNYIFQNCKCFSEALPIPNYSDNITIDIVPFCHKLSKGFIEYLKTIPNPINILNNKETAHLTSSSVCHDHFLNSWIDDGSCISPCTSKSYSWSNINAVSWPTVTFTNTPNKILISDIQSNINQKMAKYNVTENDLVYSTIKTTSDIISNRKLGSFKIVPQTPSGLKITESENYPLTNFLSTIGSILVLWVGISIINIIEFFEMIFNIFRIICDCGKSN